MLPCTNNDNKSCMLELGKQNATRNIIRPNGKIVHSHHAKPGDCLQHNLVGRAGRSLSCCVIWVLDFWLSIQKLLAFARPYFHTTVYCNAGEKEILDFILRLFITVLTNHKIADQLKIETSLRLVHSHGAKHEIVGRAGRSLSCGCHLGFSFFNLMKKNAPSPCITLISLVWGFKRLWHKWRNPH